MEHKKDKLHLFILIILAIQPLIDMDYLFYDFLNQFGIPRLSTIIKFIVIPFLVLIVFLRNERKKQTVMMCTATYILAFLIYFVFHVRQGKALVERLYLTENFYFNTFQELTYLLTMIMPFFVVYLSYCEGMKKEDLKKITIAESAFVSLLIVLGDLFLIARSTYYGDTVGNVFTWFTGIYSWYHPRTLASKFYFSEGNTIGILLFMTLPMLYYYMANETDKKKQRLLGVLIALQSIAMQMLATRVATYGAILAPLLFGFYYIVFGWLQKKNFSLVAILYAFCMAALSCVLVFLQLRKVFDPIPLLSMIGIAVGLIGYFVIRQFSAKEIRDRLLLFMGLMAIVFSCILDRTPAIQNQKVDAKNDVALLHNGMADLGLEELKNAEDLVPGSAEYINFYVYMFETYGINARYIQSVPSMYYTEYYSYQHDPKFWVDVTFMPVFDRVSGRQIETIFFNYKYATLTPQEKFLGMGYSTFMNGSIVLEKDFKQQLYTLGYIGFALCALPWLLIVVFGFVLFVKKGKEVWTLENILMATILVMGLASAWISGHVLDQFMTSIYMAIVIAVLLRHILEEK